MRIFSRRWTRHAAFAGIALGFDRLAMIAPAPTGIGQVLWLPPP